MQEPPCGYGIIFVAITLIASVAGLLGVVISLTTAAMSIVSMCNRKPKTQQTEKSPILKQFLTIVSIVCLSSAIFVVPIAGTIFLLLSRLYSSTLRSNSCSELAMIFSNILFGVHVQPLACGVFFTINSYSMLSHNTIQEKYPKVKALLFLLALVTLLVQICAYMINLSIPTQLFTNLNSNFHVMETLSNILLISSAIMFVLHIGLSYLLLLHIDPLSIHRIVRFCVLRGLFN